MALEYLVAFVVMLSVLIFVHELGHFLVAKACGVRVLKFSLGFGNPIGFGRYRLRWKRGHTEYVAAWIPLGGFVKMLGENPGEEVSDEAYANPDETLPGKPLPQKLAIVFAGPAANLLLPILLFMAILAVGLDRRGSVVGSVELGSPAAVAGIQAGDRIVSVDGAPVRFWEDMEEAVVPHPGSSVAVAFERAGVESVATLTVASRTGLDEFGETVPLGWIGLEAGRLRAQIGIPDAGAPARAAGLLSSDRVVSLAGQPIEDWEGFAAAYAAAGTSGDVSIEVERGAPGDPADRSAGAGPGQHGRPRSRSRSRGDRRGRSPTRRRTGAVSNPGDVVLALDGAPVASFGAFAEAIVRTSEGGALQLEVARGDRTRAGGDRARAHALRAGHGNRGPPLHGGCHGPAAASRQRGPRQGAQSGGGPAARRRHDRGPHPHVPAGPRSSSSPARCRASSWPVPSESRRLAGEAYRRGWESYLTVMVLISINLGILNLLPVPILDGGQALVFIIEAIKRGPLSLRTREVVQQLGLTVLVLLMGLAFWNDISRNWSRVIDWLRSGTGL